MLKDILNVIIWKIVVKRVCENIVINVKVRTLDDLWNQVEIVELKKHVGQLEDAPLVMQYVYFLGLCKCDNCETSVSMFKRLLESNGPYISRFLKKGSPISLFSDL